MPTVSIVILSHNKLQYTRPCLESYLASTYTDWELVVVDNGSTDGSVEWLRDYANTVAEHGQRLVLIENDRNVGCSTARNQGIEASSGDYIVFCDNDVAVRRRNWLETFLARFAQDPKLGMLGPKLVYPYAPHPIQCAGAAVSAKGRVQFCGRGESRDHADFQHYREVQCLISACCIGKADLLRQVNGFDEVYNPVEFEDIDLCYKIRDAGYTVGYEPDVEMYHFENVTTEGTASLPNTYLIVKNGMTFKQRWHHMFTQESGPAETDCGWRDIPPRRLGDVPWPEPID